MLTETSVSRHLILSLVTNFYALPPLPAPGTSFGGNLILPCLPAPSGTPPTLSRVVVRVPLTSRFAYS